MNQNIPGDPLDTALHQWADERTVSSDQLDNLQERIVSALGDEDFSSTASAADAAREDTAAADPVGTVVPGPLQEPIFGFQSAGSRGSQPADTWRASVARILAGVTVAVLAIVIGAFIQLKSQQQPVPRIVHDDQPAMPEYARLNDDQLRSRRVLLSEMKSLFGDRLTWLAETDARIEFGLSDRQDSNADSTSEDAAEQLAVRVVVEKRASADSDWQLAWSVDVMSRSEELVEFAPSAGDGTSMTLWAYALPDGMVAVDSELSFSDEGDDGDKSLTSAEESVAFRAAFSHVQQDRLPSEELLIGSDGVEYRVFQTVAVLDKKVG